MTASTTKNNTKSTSQGASESTLYEVGTTVHVAPSTLLLKRNIREAKPDADLIRSVKDLGVVQPIVAVLTDDGDLVVRTGHRRTLAGIEAGDAPVPVYITGHDSDDNAAEIDRIIRQRDENTHRAGLSTADDLGVVGQLAAFGLSAAQITKKTRIKRANVDTALSVLDSDLAKAATLRYESLTLDQAAAVADFEDQPETVKALIAAASTGQFEHVAQRARDDRARTQAMREATEAIQATGVTVIDRPTHGSPALRVDRLVSIEDGTDVDQSTHASCPGHVAWLGQDWVYVDTNGDPIPDEEDMDPEVDVEEAYANAEQVQRWVAIYGCSDPHKHGHQDRYTTHGTTRAASAQMSDADREKAKQERKLVIENNKAWDAATTVRREWLAAFAARKTLPKGAGAFLAAALTADCSLVGELGGDRLAADWLGVKATEYGRSDFAKVVAKATENRALVVALVRVLGSYESRTDRLDWRQDGTHSPTGRYLRFLQSAGYGLSDVEEFTITKRTV